jgi:dihydroflavonol-4-reductase
VKTILVTGATGCIGSNLIIELLDAGYTVRAFHRQQSNLLTLNNVDVEHFIGDIRDSDSLKKAVRGCDTVFHTAAIVSFWKKKREEQLEINVQGTRNVVDACRECGVEKLVHTSSVAALGYRNDGKLIDETTRFNWDERITYKYSKHLAELEVLRGVELGLHAVIVNPTVVIGPRDQYIHGGQIIRDVKRGRVPAYVKGGMNIVSVHDVVHGHIAAAEMGKNGERYILGGINLTHRDVFSLTAKIVGGTPPKIQAPVWFVKSVATACDLFGTITNREPWITSQLISGVGKNNWYSSEKARKELNYTPTIIDQAIREAYEWYVREEMM